MLDVKLLTCTVDLIIILVSSNVSNIQVYKLT